MVGENTRDGTDVVPVDPLKYYLDFAGMKIA